MSLHSPSNCWRKALFFGGYYSPSNLLITIGRRCPNLARCHFDLHNMYDDDPYALSQCRRIHDFSLRYPIPITNGLSRLTNLPQLAELNLHYSLGKYINTRLLLDFTRSCPRLDSIALADYNSRTSLFNNPSAAKAISELFAAGAELCAYLEPHYSPPSEFRRETVLDSFIIRIDNLRRYISSS